MLSSSGLRHLNISMRQYTFTTYLLFQTHNIVIHNRVCIIIIIITLLLIWLQRYIVLKCILTMYRLQKHCIRRGCHCCFVWFHGLCDVRARNWEYIDLQDAHRSTWRGQHSDVFTPYFVELKHFKHKCQKNYLNQWTALIKPQSYRSLTKKSCFRV